MHQANSTPQHPLPQDFVGKTGRGQHSLTIPQQLTANSTLDEIFMIARRDKASDVHLSARNPLIFRINGQLKIVTDNPIGAERLSLIIKQALPASLIETFEKSGDLEYVYTLEGFGRFRIALIKQRQGWDLTARLIPLDIPSFESTGMPPACAQLTKWAQGLVLVTGPAGCGKTTTLAVLVDMINQARHDHIITIENPVEIVYTPKKCQITQREINLHTQSQHHALRAALREDPDILVVSELRDLQSIQLAISAAETGHLVFGTMNTTNAAQTISRVIDSFPSDEQPIVRNMIAESLRGVICQQLIPTLNGNGMVVAYEVLIVNASVANLIREGKIAQITNAITTGKSFGMVLMDNSLQQLAQSGIIASNEACERSSNPAQMMQLINH